MNLAPKIILILLSVLVPAISFATEAKVIAYKASCERLLLQTEKGYLLLKQQGNSGYHPKKNDKVEGFFIENFGVSHLHKVSANEVMWVVNEFAPLNKDEATKKYVQQCGPIETNPIKKVIKKILPATTDE